MNSISEFCFFILNPEGKEVGYFFLFEEHGHFIWKTVAVSTAFQSLGLGTFGMHQGLKSGKEKNIDHYVAALVKKGAPSEGLTSKPSAYEWVHEYKVFKKEI